MHRNTAVAFQKEKKKWLTTTQQNDNNTICCFCFVLSRRQFVQEQLLLTERNDPLCPELSEMLCVLRRARKRRKQILSSLKTHTHTHTHKLLLVVYYHHRG